MKSRWNEDDARKYEGELGLRVYSSRLLGGDPSLVLHGGGNTSVKVRETAITGEEEEILYVKGSGWDLATIEAEGYTPVRLAPMLELARLDRLSDPEMVNELKTRTTRAGAPTPSVETILHAGLPFKYVDHTHADAVVTVTNSPDGKRRVREIYGDRVVVIPYVMPGFDLAREALARFAAERGDETVGMVLMSHGIFTFGDDARESYERMIELVDQAERHLAAAGAWELSVPEPAAAGDGSPGDGLREEIAELRRELSRVAGRPMILSVTGLASGLAFARRDDVAEISQRGPATPDHVLRTKRLPLLGRDVDAYAEAYRRYFAEHEPRAKERKTMLDPAPRVVLDPVLGLCCAGKTAAEAGIVADLYEHTIDCILRAERLGGWLALATEDIFEVEYWDLEQAKLRKGGAPPAFQGEVALVTGAASGIGRATVEALRARGAAVVGLDRDPAVEGIGEGGLDASFLGIIGDVTDRATVRAALEQATRRFGGLDLLVLNAGVFPASRRIAELSDERWDDEWRRALSVNLDANLVLMRDAHPLLRRAPKGGRVVVVGSKNVPAPGPGAAAYSVSKAGLTQLVRVAALEWAADGIRVNALHPDGVFDTALWSDAVLASRAEHYGLTVEQYKTKNLLGTEVTSRDVGELAAAMCGPLFAKTTGAQLPVDGGNDRVV